ncbi:hypothetical protein D3C76_574070 [compost metagenome]
MTWLNPMIVSGILRMNSTMYKGAMMDTSGSASLFRFAVKSCLSNRITGLLLIHAVRMGSMTTRFLFILLKVSQ